MPTGFSSDDIKLPSRSSLEACCMKSSLIRNLRLSESLKKNQLWNGIISITLLEGKNVSGGSMTEMFVQLKLGDQRYKSKDGHFGH